MEAENHKNKRAKVTAQQQVTLEFQNPQPAAPVGIVIPQRDPQRYTPAEQARRAAIRTGKRLGLDKPEKQHHIKRKSSSFKKNKE